MNQRGKLAELRASLKKQVAALTISALGFSLLGIISAPQASALNNYAAQTILVDAFGRADEQVKVLVSSKLASGVTTSADQVAVGIVARKTGVNEYDYTQSGFTSANFATTQIPTSISANEALYSFSLSAPAAGLYFIKTCISTSTTPITWSDFYNSFTPYSWNLTRTADVYCENNLIEIGGAPTRAVFSNNNLGAYPATGTGNASAKSQVTFFDASGYTTKLLPSESFTITSTSASLSAQYGVSRSAGTGNIPSASKTLTFSGSSGDADGAYRFNLSDTLNVNSQIKGQFETTFGSGNFNSPIASFNFSTAPIATTGYKAKLMPNEYQLSMASGTDGKLYYWGQLSSRYPGNSSYLPAWINGNSNKPTKLDFTPTVGQINSLTVKKIVSSSYVLSNDGVLYRNFGNGRISGIALKNKDLQPVVFPSLAGVQIADITADLSYLLDTQGRLWKSTNIYSYWVTDYQLVDVTPIGSPVFKKITYSANPLAVFALTTTGDVYSQGSNTNGLLGQNSNGAPTAIGKVALPSDVTAADLYSGNGFAWIVTSVGAVWAWGNNTGGQLAKDPTLIPYSTSPILGILPVGVKGTIWNLNPSFMTFLANDSRTVYYAQSSGWVSSNNSQIGSNTIQDMYWGGNGTLILQEDNRIYTSGGAIGNCISSYAYIRSVGQFGPVSTDDAIRYSGVFLQNDSGTSTINTTFSMRVGETATVQVVQPRTNCYDVSDLIYRWDLDGSGNFAIPGTSSLSQTGYQAFNAVLNFVTAGRKEVRLKLSTPDGLDLILKFTVGVEPKIAPIIDFGETRTGLVSGSNQSALGIGTDGNLYTWGNNSSGQLSTAISAYGFRYLALPVALPNGAKPLTVYSYEYDWSYRTNFVVDISGKVWGSGSAFGISGSSGNIETFTALSHLSSYNILDIQATLNRAVALTKSGQIITWLFGRTDSARVPNQIVSLAGINIKNFTIQYDGNSGHRISAVDTDGALWQVPIASDGTAGDATKVNSIIDVRQLSWNGNQATLVTGSGGVWYSVNGATPFAQVSLPVGVTAVDAMYSGTLYLLDSTKKIWTANPSQSGNTVTMSTWTAYAAQANGQASSSDQPIFQHRGSSFISFASGNLMYLGSYDNYQAGRCNVYSSSYSGNRVFSTGQFGVENVADQIITTASVAIASQNAANFSNGQFFSANPGDAVVIRLVNPRSGCFNGSSQLTALADTAGTGNYNVVVPISNEGGGTYSFTLSATAPSSGRKSIGVRISTPLGTSSIFSLGLGVFGTETVTAVVPRTNPINTSQAAVFAVASDGFAYGWSTPTDVSYDYQGTTMSFMNMITSTPPRNSGSPTKLEMPGGARVREAIPFTQCCTDRYSRYMFGVLAVDEFGRTWTWGTDSTMEVANGYTYQNTPLTPTQIPALVGENVIRLSVSSSGGRALALTSKGVVYQWYAGERTTPTRVASLAGIKIVDIYTNAYISFALADTGELYAFDGRGYYAGISATGNAIYSTLASAQKVDLPETVTAIMPLSDLQLTAVKTASGKIFVWGLLYSQYNGNSIQILTPTRIDLPSSRTANLAGSIHSSGYSSNVITASDGTWWDLTLNAQNQITYYQRTGVSSAVNTTVRSFASGSGLAMVLNSGAIYTTNSQIAGTCGPISTYTRVMSDGQFGPLYKADQIYITVNGNEITRPNTATSVGVTGWSACDGGANITFTADLVGNGVYGDSLAGTVSQDGSRATGTYTFTKTANGPINMRFKATTAAGLSGTAGFYTKVVPAPLPGRQIGISVNAGDRYTNSSNVNLSLVWPDGTTTIYVSNDGGFAPGTVSNYDLQYTVPWVLPPQAVIPLPSIVYARFDNDPATYYFDDIILDAIVPVLTYASAR
jgi:alpha-tubulin suppressor-like RCC1 family protein